MVNEGDPDVLRHLARRNLRRGHRLNLPSARDFIASISALDGTDLPRLTTEELCTSATADALAAGGFLDATPLWFYVLKEAECLGNDGRLDPLSSRLVAESLAGLVSNDAASFWSRPGTDDNGRWHPADGVTPGGQRVDSVAVMLRVSGPL